MNISLSDHFTYKKLLRFTFPSIVMMILTSIYGVVDGVFVSNFVGSEAFASINIIMPFLMILGAIGFMTGSGGSALVALTFGTGNEKKAKEIFSLLVYVLIAVGFLFTVGGEILLAPMARLLGADEILLPYCVRYGRIILLALIPFMLQNVFQSFFVAAEKPKLGLSVIVASGVTNIILDALFVGAFGFGLAGAAAATVCGELLGGIIPIIYFSRKNSSLLRLCKTRINISVFIKTCVNGSSELMTNLSSSIVNSLYNVQLMKFAGENGVAAYGTIMYVNFIFVAIFFGYSIGSAPLISFNYGAGNHDELKNLFKKSMTLVTIWGILLAVISQIIAMPLARLFVGYDNELLAMTQEGFRIYCLVYLINGFNIFGSAFFTSLNNGIISAIISFLRTLVFQIVSVIILPIIFGIKGIWFAVIVAEMFTLCFTAAFLIKQRHNYHYV